jgi:putative DNA methylase
VPEVEMPHNPFSVRPPIYGFMTYDELFTKRQLVSLNTLSALLTEVKEIIREYMKGRSIDRNVDEYVNAVVTYLSLAIDKGINIWSTGCSWMADRGAFRETFARQALPMVWDYAEANIFSNSGGNLSTVIERAEDVINFLPFWGDGQAIQHNATEIFDFLISSPVISTDPPYYNNIDYADLSDYFYIWLRRFLSDIYPSLFATVLVPKKPELVATPYRFDGDANKAKQFFEDGLGRVFHNLGNLSDANYPVTVFYAFKQIEEEQADEDDAGNEKSRSRSSTGWETILESLIGNNFLITGTWPMHTESTGRSMAQDKNALASSIVLVCRPRLADAYSATRREFLSALKKELPPALRQLQLGSIAPVDFAQAAIGPGMAVYSRYAAVLEADGSPMRVRAALAMINQTLDEYLSEQEGEYDSDTRWALAWFEQFGHNEAAYGSAETLSTAKNTSVHGLEEAGILVSRAGKVRLLKRDELDSGWNPDADKRLTVWEAAQHLIQTLDKNGEQAAGTLLTQLGGLSETIRDLGYRLYTICERKGWTQDALAYNMLVVAWPRLKELASRQTTKQDKLM